LSRCKCPPGFKGDGFHCQGMYSLLTLLRFPANLRQNCVELSEPGLPLLIPVGIADVDECRDKLACSCPHCSCKNTWGGFDCRCNSGMIYINNEDTCIGEP